MKYKKSENYIVSHCYGVIHSMRLLKRLRNENIHGVVKGCVFISIGVNCPVGPSASTLSMIPSFALGMYVHLLLIKLLLCKACDLSTLLAKDLCLCYTCMFFVLQTSQGWC